MWIECMKSRRKLNALLPLVFLCTTEYLLHYYRMGGWVSTSEHIDDVMRYGNVEKYQVP